MKTKKENKKIVKLGEVVKKVAQEFVKKQEDVKMDSPAVQETTTTTTEKKEKKVKASHHVPAGSQYTACGQFAADPRLSISTGDTPITCKACLARLDALANPKERKSKETKPPVTITCVDCGAERVVPASQANTVTRCKDCQAKHLKAKRKAKGKERAARKHASEKDYAELTLATILSTNPETTPNQLRALATLIYKTYPKWVEKLKIEDEK